ncbi:hypothetical protein [Halalkalibacter urbisdiaboli]|uniref:hypothetical protein n=1 Tax=Halalkalibacter urbisdiaboli TaxID=1960589 RepID=UPI000B44714E|nr:hypothetical protein [Halalkalibacter urbisdiaboli]
MGSQFYNVNRLGPKVFLQNQSENEIRNQHVFYSNQQIDGIEKNINQLFKIINSHTQNIDYLTGQVVKQEKAAKKLSAMQEKIHRTVEQKGDMQQELISRFEQYKGEGTVLQTQLTELVDSYKNVNDKLTEIEHAKHELFEQLSEQQKQIEEYKQRSERVEKEQSEQKTVQDQFEEQLQLQNLDYRDLLEKVRENKKEQKCTQERVNQLIEKSKDLTTQQREQEHLHLELYCELLQLQTVTRESSTMLKQAIAKLESEVKHLHVKKSVH